MRFDLRSPNWWWILPLTLLVQVVIADPFDNHHRRQTSPVNVLDLMVNKRNVYDLNGTPQMPRGGGGPIGNQEAVSVKRDLAALQLRQVQDPGGGPGGSEPGHEGSHNIKKRFDPYLLLEKKGTPKMPGGGPGGSTEPPCTDESCHDVKRDNVNLPVGTSLVKRGTPKMPGGGPGGSTKPPCTDESCHDARSTDQENNARLFLNADSVDHGKHIGHGVAKTKDKRINERALETMEVAARDGKFEETMRIEYLKKRGMGRVSCCGKRIQQYQELTMHVDLRHQGKAAVGLRSPKGPIHTGGNWCDECDCC